MVERLIFTVAESDFIFIFSAEGLSRIGVAIRFVDIIFLTICLLCLLAGGVIF